MFTITTARKGGTGSSHECNEHEVNVHRCVVTYWLDIGTTTPETIPYDVYIVHVVFEGLTAR
jgi:hypothetical protein